MEACKYCCCADTISPHKSSKANNLDSMVQVVNSTNGDPPKPLGVQIIESRGLFAEAKWFWIGAGALLGYILFFNVLFVAALTYLNREFSSPKQNADGDNTVPYY